MSRDNKGRLMYIACLCQNSVCSFLCNTFYLLVCIGYLSYIRSLMVTGLSHPQTDVPLNLYFNFKHHVYPYHFRVYCKFVTGVNCFWIINNSQQVLSHVLTTF